MWTGVGGYIINKPIGTYYNWRETDWNVFIFLSLCFSLRQKQIKNNDGKTQHNKLRLDGGSGGKMSLNGRKRGFGALNFPLITCVFIGTEIGIGMHSAYTVSTECHNLLFPPRPHYPIGTQTTSVSSQPPLL